MVCTWDSLAVRSWGESYPIPYYCDTPYVVSGTRYVSLFSLFMPYSFLAVHCVWTIHTPVLSPLLGRKGDMSFAFDRERGKR